MTRQEAVDIIARKSVALTAKATTAFLPERSYSGPDRKEIQHRIGELADQLDPTTDEYELAYDVIVHTRERL